MAERKDLEQLLAQTRQDIPAFGFLENQLIDQAQVPPPEAPEFRYYLILLVNKLVEVEAAMASQPEEVRHYFQEKIWKALQQKKAGLVREFFWVFAAQFSETSPSIVPEVRVLESVLASTQSLTEANSWDTLETLHTVWQTTLAAPIPHEWQIVGAENEQIFPPVIRSQREESLRSLILTEKEAVVLDEMERLLSLNLSHDAQEVALTASRVSDIDGKHPWQSHTKEDLISLRNQLSAELNQLSNKIETYVTVYPRLRAVKNKVLGPVHQALSQVRYYIETYPVRPPTSPVPEVDSPEVKVPEERQDLPMLDMFGQEIRVGWHGLYEGIYPGLDQSDPLYVLADVVVLEIQSVEREDEKYAKIKILDIRRQGAKANFKVGETLYVQGFYLGDVTHILQTPNKKKRRK